VLLGVGELLIGEVREGFVYLVVSGVCLLSGCTGNAIFTMGRIE